MMPQTSQLFRCPNGACRHIAALEEGGHSQTPRGICCQKCGHINAMDEVSWREMIREAKRDKRKSTDGSVKRPLTPQRMARLDRDAVYAELRKIYLKENPVCVCCGQRCANQIHHIVSGTSGRSRSLLNSDTWLAVCSTECHDSVAAMTPDAQKNLKQTLVGKTIERLRK